MIAFQRVGSMLLMSAGLAACGSAAEPPRPPPIEETVFSDAAAAEQKAREVQNVVDEHAHATDSAIQESESAQ